MFIPEHLRALLAKPFVPNELGQRGLFHVKPRLIALGVAQGWANGRPVGAEQRKAPRCRTKPGYVTIAQEAEFARPLMGRRSPKASLSHPTLPGSLPRMGPDCHPTTLPGPAFCTVGLRDSLATMTMVF
jgi:hypothetical protein